jgi:hypothetical protein
MSRPGAKFSISEIILVGIGQVFPQLLYESARPHRCRANSVHIRQPRPYSGLGFQVRVFEPVELFPLGSAAEDKPLLMLEVEIESIRKMLARAADTGHSN